MVKVIHINDPTVIEEEEYAVYSAGIRALMVREAFLGLGGPGPTQRLHISRAAELYRTPNSLPAEWEIAGDDLFGKHFKRCPEEQKQLNFTFVLAERFGPDIPYVLIDDDGLDIESFNRRYPEARGRLKLSRVGFNPARDRALFCLVFVVMALMGRGGHVLLQKKDTLWTVKDAAVEVVS
jgi:hypothetical protein